jgi:hypothetical protein
MPLRKSPTLTDSALEANRRNAQKSTGPRTLRGKAQSGMNALRTGQFSPVYQKLLLKLGTAPPFSLRATSRAILTPEQARNPVFAELVAMALKAEGEGDDSSKVDYREIEKRILFLHQTKPECD